MCPSVSIVIPVYNAENTLENCLKSVLEQDLSDFEVIVIDDGSTDNSTAIIHEFEKKYSSIRFYRTSHRGIVPSLNYSIRMAKAPLIARMDSDDTMPEDRLSTQKEYLDRHPKTGLVSGNVFFSGNRSANKGYALYVEWLNSLKTYNHITLNRFIESPLAHPSVMFRKELVHKFGAYHAGPFPEDYELWLRWLEKGVIMGKVDSTVLYWKDHPKRHSRTHSRYSYHSFYALKAPYLARWLKNNNPYHPNITLWGSGRINRRRASLLETYGIHIEDFIDINPNKIGKYISGKPVLSPADIRKSDKRFVVSYVSLRNQRQKIKKELKSKNFINGKNFIFAA